MQNQQTHYDYIIAGAGASGLSLLVRMIDAGLHKQKRILIIDKDEKQKNDRTWSFWEKEADIFESIIYKEWKQLDFYVQSDVLELENQPYSYKMIRGIDFYNYCKNIIAQAPSVKWVKDDIQSIENIDNQTVVKTTSSIYTADYTFSSLFSREKLVLKPNQYMLLQHFKGYIIETKEPRFNPEKATLMDFRMPQTHGATFVYALPFSPTKAFIEYTLFTETLLTDSEYDAALLDYIKNYLKIDEFDIIGTEFGVIPMTDYLFPSRNGRIINIGTAGGFTKASSGYTFKNIQKSTAKIVKHLLKGHSPTNLKLRAPWRFEKYDATLLHILVHKKLTCKEIFERMFTTTSAKNILAFLDNETTIWEEIRMFSKLQISVFLLATIKEFLKK
jgi:lycopene beta-cyclase